MDVWISGFGQALRNGRIGFGGKTIELVPPPETGDVNGVWNMAVEKSRRQIIQTYNININCNYINNNF